jgi:hypothetical protein
MKKQTAIQQFIYEIRWYTRLPVVPTIEDVIAFAESKLEVEREQIETAYWDGGQDVPISEETCKEYYNKTYGTE